LYILTLRDAFIQITEFFYADGQTDTHDEANSRFSQFWEGA